MPAWTPKRASRVRRRPDGTFLAWTGGKTKAQLPKNRRSQLQHGIGSHIGALFAAEHGRRARTGDLHRTKTRTGAYHGQAWWYIKTPHGWRKSPTGTRRPTPAEVRRVVAASRRGRPPRRPLRRRAR